MSDEYWDLDKMSDRRKSTMCLQKARYLYDHTGDDWATYPNRSGHVSVEWVFDESGRPCVMVYIDGRPMFIANFTEAQKIKAKAVYNLSVGFARKSYVGKNCFVQPSEFKSFYKEFHVTCERVARIVRAFVYKTHGLPLKKWSGLFHGGVTGFSDNFIKMMEHVWQADSDGNNNITPLMVYMSMTPDELKRVLGKGLWKSLCKNTYSRNLKLCKALPSRVVGFDLTHNCETVKSYLREGNKAPTTLISGVVIGRSEYGDAGFHTRTALPWFLNVAKSQKANGIPYKKTLSNIWKRQDCGEMSLRSMIYDTRRLQAEVQVALQIEIPEINPNWSVRRMKEHHDMLMVRSIEARHMGTLMENEKWGNMMSADVSDLYKETSGVFNFYEWKILTTYKGITQEGVEQHHCVGAYAKDALNGTYTVVSIHGGGKRSTLGLNRDKNSGRVRLQQHYMACNKAVTEDLVEVAEKVVLKINSWVK